MSKDKGFSEFCSESPPPNCPLNSTAFALKMREIEDGIKSNTKRLEELFNRVDAEKELRHDRNTQINEVIDAERVERYTLTRTVEKLSEYVEDSDETMTNIQQNVVKIQAEVSKLVEVHKELMEVIKGNWASDGLVKKHTSLTGRVDTLESAINHSKSFLAGVLFVGAVVGSLIGTIASAATIYLKMK